jgi:hypothetical protein
MSIVTSVAKFLTAAIGLVVALGFLDPGTAQTAVGVVTAVAVYFVPNG